MLFLASIVQTCVSGLGTKEQWQKAKDFFEDKDTKAYDKYLAQGLDHILTKAEWVERDRDDVQKWLDKNEY